MVRELFERTASLHGACVWSGKLRSDLRTTGARLSTSICALDRKTQYGGVPSPRLSEPAGHRRPDHSQIRIGRCSEGVRSYYGCQPEQPGGTAEISCRRD